MGHFLWPKWGGHIVATATLLLKWSFYSDCSEKRNQGTHSTVERDSRHLKLDMPSWKTLVFVPRWYFTLSCRCCDCAEERRTETRFLPYRGFGLKMESQKKAGSRDQNPHHLKCGSSMGQSLHRRGTNTKHQAELPSFLPIPTCRAAVSTHALWWGERKPPPTDSTG